MTNTLNWHYKPDDLSANNDKMLAEGDYRVCINSVFPTVAKNGTEGVEITYDVNGHRNSLKHYIWLNRNNVQRTNQTLGQFFNSFDIGPNEQNNCASWKSKKGAVHVIHSEYKGRMIAKVEFCINRDEQDKLPQWQEEMTDDKMMPPEKIPQFTSWEDFNF